MNREYSIKELKRAINEASQEFKAVKFNDDNTKINKDAYKDMERATKNYDGKQTAKTHKTKNYPPNYRGMETLRPENMSDEMRKRFDAQLDGYVDDKAKQLHKDDAFGNASFGDGSLGKALAQKAKEDKESREMASAIGLTGSKTKFPKKDNQMYESKKITKLTFKNTTFLTEQHMLSKLPDDYKVEGKQILMKDKSNNEYLVEWHKEEPNVTCKSKINEDLNRIKELFNYKRNIVTSDSQTRLAENNNFNDVLSKARRLMHS